MNYRKHNCFTMWSTSLALLVLTATSALAQESPPALFEVVATAAADLTPKQERILQKLGSDKTTVETTLVKMNPAALQADSMSMQLDKTEEKTLIRSSYKEFGGERFLWSGVLDEKRTDKEPPRYARFMVAPKRVEGSFFDRKYVYSVQPLGDGLHVIVKHDSSKAPNDEPPEFDEKEKEAAEKPAPKVTASEPLDPQADVLPTADGTIPEIAVLVLYTPAVGQNHDSMPAFVATLIALTNQTYVDSDIPCRLTLVETAEVNYAESGDLALDVDRLSGTSDGQIDDVHQLRNEKSADIVVLLLDSGDGAGYADAIAADETTAFAVVDDEYAAWYFTFAHEIGHLFGARHNVAADPSTAPFPYGHGYYNAATGWRTIMSYACPGGECTRVGIWSGPNNSHQGEPAGSAQYEDNARVLRERAATMAAFR